MIVPSQLQVLATQAAPHAGPRPAPRRHPRRGGAATDIAIRLAGRRDGCAISALELMEGRSLGAGPRLLAELGGVPVAAVALSDDSAVADPFERTAGVVDLLRVRAAQLRREDSPARAPRLGLLERLAR
jgi:hypothetical protein